MAFIVDKCEPWFTGGYEHRVLALAQGLAVSHDVRVYTSLPVASVQREGVQFVRCSSLTFQAQHSGQRSLLHGLRFALALRHPPPGLVAWKPDLVIVEAIPYLHLRSVDRWARELGCVLAIDVCEAWLDYPYWRGPLGSSMTHVIARLLRKGVRDSDWVIAISRVTAQSLERNFGADPGRLSVIPLAPETPVASTGRTAAPVAEPRFDFAYVGRMVREKRPEDFIGALGLLRAQHGWVGRAVLLGSGPRLEPSRKLVRRLGLESQVELPGFASPAFRNETLRSSRVLVLPSEREGFSLAALEGLAHGLPAVVAVPKYPEVFGVSEFVDDGVEGLYYPVGDRQRLADQLSRLLEDTELCRRLGIAGRLRAAQYRWEEIVDRLESEFRRVAGVEPAPAAT
ncbi:MAG: glycosyltransferase family 4 protein [Thermoplasmata archaeon]|nr:glycosyltransferase family 4 protein [Thermoplasmata archaeon]